jgi:hypothetical protein
LSLKSICTHTQQIKDDETSSDASLSLQLSSPVEEAKLQDKVTFSGVEPEAMLVVSRGDLSSDVDLQSYTKFSAMQDEQVVNEVILNLRPPQNEEDVPELVEDEVAVRLRLTFYPSAKDRIEELYEMLNKASQRKQAAIELLRQAAVASSRAGQVATVKATPSRAVPAGFLNKKKHSPIMSWYKSKVEPTVQWVSAVWASSKNVVLFVGFVGLAHFQGQLLAVPAPV